ncbi:MAG: hypothetical protein AVDCRST_MAG59-2752 [uncultured Thermomicrobiales bacterium]|uniref:Uncharacterized protein n=1 Tax=uncultured Thermomicrobiales bacterium TaxID=1645740 RepID=A0A6J4V1U3_9BACT|nr:MAG: hypothetical protein AVDCRST_MAG59-2752 [uncultured Thermomicrobiales bacterium]
MGLVVGAGLAVEQDVSEGGWVDRLVGRSGRAGSHWDGHEKGSPRRAPRLRRRSWWG